jgi:glutathione synthase/RimK-type ligase-like ATP-grasp enzyme
MTAPLADACVLNTGPEAWVFAEHAARMADALGVPVREAPSARSYVLGWPPGREPSGASFIPWPALRCTADKRLAAEAFDQHAVPVPETVILPGVDALARFLADHPETTWVLKYPTGTGAAGHRIVRAGSEVPRLWPLPLLVQRFIAMPRPEVYRVYVVGDDAVLWNARRYPEGVATSPFVAHARGARYVPLGQPPPEAAAVALAAVSAVGLEGRFGAVDLLPEGERWLVLEVNTDGPYQHVDRDLGDLALASWLDARIADSFWRWARGG